MPVPHETVVQRWDDEAVLVDLGGPEVARVQPRPSIWPALLLAVFTLLTGAGLAMSTTAPRPGDHTVGPGTASPAATPEAIGRRPGLAPPEPGTSAEMPGPPAGATAGPVVAEARAVRASGHWTIRVSGAAAGGVTSIDVRVLVGAMVVGGGTVKLDPAASLDRVDGRSGGDVAPWFADIPLASNRTMGGGDAVATVEVRWLAGPDRSGTAASLVVTLGDGRAAD